ncbi:MAG: hypothetical protein IJ727_04685 [Treponema sp.]|nr:hypothetical protein [Treponema sp.]
MKMKHIFKLFTIVMMLMLAIFTTGCESQQEKYTKASNELATYEIKWFENFKAEHARINAKLDKLKEEGKTGPDPKLLDEMQDVFHKTIDEYDKNVKERLENLQKIAKGDPELEKDVRNKWNEFNGKRKEFMSGKVIMDSLFEEIRQEYGIQKNKI